jgi:alpha-D-ribose 1-methylphosphonate 5-triphosphate synthase subunit PhnH
LMAMIAHRTIMPSVARPGCESRMPRADAPWLPLHNPQKRP